MFSIKAGFPTRWVAKTPAGFRIDAEFHTTQPEYGISVAPEEYWNVWGGAVKVWLTASPQCLKDWKARFTDNGQLRAIDSLAAPLSGVPATDRAQLAQEAQVAGFGDLLRELRKYVREKELDCPAWLGLEGRIVSGVDWALLRADGVIEFDGQWVLTDGELDDKSAVLINARTSGSVDLCKDAEPRPLTLDHAGAMVRAIDAKAETGIALAVKFEAPQEPEPWASKKYTRRKGQLTYVRLSRGQFVAIGKLKAFGTSGAAVDLGVYQVKG
jgi:hypothetical protein